ncbi:MAG: hypothetical protein GY865_00905 [candidate division Zixibacteria bacterium]|nr:hypothetical protein [candidate division Zixibacteria bacterium]
MSYTNIELVRKYISFGNLPGGLQKDYPVTFTGLEKVILPGHSIIEDTVVVKAVGSAEPTFEEVTLGDSTILLAQAQLVPNSVAVASDSSLGIIYTENADYSIDYTNGKISRIGGGAIGNGNKTSLWYQYYTQYNENSDYSVGYQSGSITRLAGSAIQIGQMVQIDYQLLQSFLNDEIIIEAVNQANAIVEGEIDIEQTFGADLVLQTAATYLAISLLCRIEAAGCLRYGGNGDKETRWWLSLGESYRSDFEKLIKKFHPGASRLNHPIRS